MPAQNTYDPARTVWAIDKTLKRVRAMDVTDIEVHLTWHHYQSLLALKGIAWKPPGSPQGESFFDAPLKVYRGHALRLFAMTSSNSGVYGRAPDGSIMGYAIPPY